MNEMNRDMHAVLYLVVCAAPPAQQVHDFVLLAQAAHWEICVIATPQATHFIDRPRLETITGHPVRSEYKAIGTADILPKDECDGRCSHDLKHYYKVGTRQCRYSGFKPTL